MGWCSLRRRATVTCHTAPCLCGQALPRAHEFTSQRHVACSSTKKFAPRRLLQHHFAACSYRRRDGSFRLFFSQDYRTHTWHASTPRRGVQLNPTPPHVSPPHRGHGYTHAAAVSPPVCTQNDRTVRVALFFAVCERPVEDLSTWNGF